MRARRRPTALAAATVIFVFAAATRLLYLLGFRSDVFWGTPIHDARRYHDWAAAWAAGKPFETGAFYQAPLYPGLLGLLYRVTGPSPGAAYVVQCAMGLGTLFLIHRIATRAYGEAAGRWSVALAALYGPLIFYETKLLPASLAVFVAALLVERVQAADAADTNSAWIVPGLVTGLAALANPGFLLAGALTAAWLGADRARAARARGFRLAVLATGLLLVLAPVAARNRLASGEWVLVSTNGGITFYQGNNPLATGVFANPEGFTGTIATQRDESRRIAEAEAGRALRDGEVSGFWFRKGLAYLASDPPHAAALLGRKLLLALASDEQPLEYNPRLDANPARWLVPLPFAVLLGLATVRWFRRNESSGPSVRIARAEVPILILLATQLALLVCFYVSARYRLPLIPALAAMAGAGAAEMASRVRASRSRLASPAVACLLVALVSLLYVPLAQSGLRRWQEAMGWADRGGAFRAAGRLGDSEAAYRSSIRLDASYPFAHLDLGKTLKRAGKRAEAEASIREALRLAPGLSEAWFDLGVLCFEQDRLEDAERGFAEAFRLAPGDALAANNLLGTRVRLGRAEPAMETYRAMKRASLAVDPPLEAWARGHEP